MNSSGINFGTQFFFFCKLRDVNPLVIRAVIEDTI